MRLPFLSPSPVLVEYRLALQEAQARCDAERAERLAAQDAADRRYADLLEKYHALRASGYGPAEQFTPPASPLSVLGPLTQAALRDAGIGLPADVKRAMTTKALSLAEGGGTDQEVAAMVRHGEPQRSV